VERTFINKTKLLRNAFLYKTGLLQAKRVVFPRSRVIILAYHTIETPRFLTDALGIQFSKLDFIKQISHIRKHHPVIDLDTLLKGLDGQIELPRNAVVITFDDGYKDVQQIALPILNKYDMPATLFITTDAIDIGRSLWTNKLYSAISNTSKNSIEFAFPDELQPKYYPLKYSKEKKTTSLSLSGNLKTLSPTLRTQMLSKLFESLEVDSSYDPCDQLPMLDWDDIRQLQSHNFTIGSHTVSHPILSKCSCEEQRKELAESKNTIENLLGIPCKVLAYPNGQPDDFTTETMRLAEEVGYEAAFSFFAGVVNPGIDMFRIPRNPIFEVPLHTFATQIS
jgi:peptidoglycan/xylan/chitin deacetylase (PgdA/CDA1 family)